MKKTTTALLTCLLLTISAWSYSQSSQTTDQDLLPVPIEFGGKKGLFVTLRLMDTISVKLIERKSLKKEKTAFQAIYANEKKITDNLTKELEKTRKEAQNNAKLNSLSELQLTKSSEALQISKEETKRARRNGLKLFGGGVVVGVAIVGLISVL